MKLNPFFVRRSVYPWKIAWYIAYPCLLLLMVLVPGYAAQAKVVSTTVMPSDLMPSSIPFQQSISTFAADHSSDPLSIQRMEPIESPQTESPQIASPQLAPSKSDIGVQVRLPPADAMRQPSVTANSPAARPSSDATAIATTGTPKLDPLFAGNSDSLVARAVGSAEGTRTPDGQKTAAYYGHIDPGNRAWNRGSFSYQHQASSPEDADARQLNRLYRQAKVLTEKAIANGITLTLEEQLNGIDLANQAPKAALDAGGYIDRLAEARSRGLQGDAGIVWARTWSFMNPVTQRWDAPGLGNTQDRIERDQARRMMAIARAVSVAKALSTSLISANPF